MMCIQPRRSLAMSALTLLAALVPATARAQVPALSQGSLIVGGSAAIDVQDDGDSEKVTSVALTPHVERFVRNGLAIGGDLTLARTSQGDYSFTTIGVGPVIALYFGDDGTTHPFVRGGVRWIHGSADSPGGSSSGTATGLHASVGLLILLSNAVGVETSLGWEHSRSSNGDGPTSSQNRYGLRAGVSAFVF